MALDKFNRLDEGITRLLERFEELKSENIEFKETVEAREKEIEALKDRLRRLDVEKTSVREKVDVLLSRLDSMIQGA